MTPHKGKEKKEQVISLSPQVAEGENVFGVCYTFACFSDNFVHVTDIFGKETIYGSLPYAATLAAQGVALRCKELGITALHVKLWATGGNRTKTPGPGAQAHSGVEVGRIEDVTPNPSDGTREKGGHRGHYL
ncbi:hypothetical protein FD755_008111 [Muntiacus reevesi]|uniref:Small ribosomal subunit protein uS11 n=1 Tax=Muntiacus reevesi TaxID=9886 RepID=A0A5J5MKY5_MUNRE|nr:hypothetical protein FD755_008111 [Muntiacus reevesi]